MKRVKIWRKRNEKHKVKNKEDKKGKKCGQGELLLTRNINKKENKFQGEKGICFEKFEKNKENETSETRYFVERDRNRREMAKTWNKQISQEKKRNDYKKGKTRRYTKGKRDKKRRKRKDPTKRN